MDTDSPNTVRFLSWDSAFLNLTTGRINAQHLSASALPLLLAAARQQGFRLIYLFVDPADAVSRAAAAAVKASLADQKATFGVAVAPAEAALPVSAALVPIRALPPSRPLEALAWQSGEYSRFRLDPRFAPGTFQRLYHEWLQNSINGQIAREVLVFQSNKSAFAESFGKLPQPQALLTLGVEAGRTDIGLLAVDAPVRGLGIGQQLVAAARQRAAAWGCTELQVATQLANAPACALYRKCGLTLRQVEYIYHIWLD